jgi:ribosomal-protein-serine acetyltransferase
MTSLDTWLSDGDVAIRPMEVDDLDALVLAVRESLADLKPWMDWAHDDFGEVEARAWLESSPRNWENGRFYAFAILDARTDELLGGCNLGHVDAYYRLANLAYWVRSSRRGQGIVGRAARLAACFGFEKLNLLRVEIVVAVGNLASQRAAEKAGAQREGLLRNRMVIGPRVCDAVMYSLAPQDFGRSLPAESL